MHCTVLNVKLRAQASFHTQCMCYVHCINTVEQIIPRSFRECTGTNHGKLAVHAITRLHSAFPHFIRISGIINHVYTFDETRRAKVTQVCFRTFSSYLHV